MWNASSGVLTTKCVWLGGGGGVDAERSAL